MRSPLFLHESITRPTDGLIVKELNLLVKLEPDKVIRETLYPKHMSKVDKILWTPLKQGVNAVFDQIDWTILDTFKEQFYKTDILTLTTEDVDENLVCIIDYRDIEKYFLRDDNCCICIPFPPNHEILTGSERYSFIEGAVSVTTLPRLEGFNTSNGDIVFWYNGCLFSIISNAYGEDFLQANVVITIDPDKLYLVNMKEFQKNV